MNNVQTAPEDAHRWRILFDRKRGSATDTMDALSHALAELETELGALADSNRTLDPAAYMLRARGKRLRPLCALLASRLGRPDPEATRTVALVSEMVHAATLLHDDVVDLGELRRGAKTARLVFGNAASVFGGDWLLIEALRRVLPLDDANLLDRLLETVHRMVAAETRQLALRGAQVAAEDTYYEIARGKTASLFAFSLWAGARAGRCDEATETAMERFGTELGLAFQIVDDVLDFKDEDQTGKDSLSDLDDGVLSLPVVYALETSPERVRAAIQARDSETMARLVRESGALPRATQTARRHAQAARDALVGAPPGAARDALEALTKIVVERRL